MLAQGNKNTGRLSQQVLVIGRQSQTKEANTQKLKRLIRAERES